MNIECSDCGAVYDFRKTPDGNCVRCGNKGGFLTMPKETKVFGRTFKRDEVLHHIRSKNEYKIKEIQNKGLLCLIVKTTLPLPIDIKKAVYIPNDQLEEYKVR